MSTIKLLVATGCFLIATSFSLYAGEMSASEYVDKYYAMWNYPRIPGDDSGPSRIANFIKNVPQELQGEVTARLLDRACSARPKKAWEVIEDVESVLTHLDPEIKLPASLDQNLYALTKDPDYIVRIRALNTLQQLNRSKDHDAIVAALSDTHDEVRAAAFAALYGRPDADAKTYQQYLQEHQYDPAYAKSVTNAKGGLSAINKAKNGDRK